MDKLERTNIQKELADILNRMTNDQLKQLKSRLEEDYPEAASGQPPGHYTRTTANIPIWVNPDGTTEPYKHQDKNYSNLCTHEYCRCKS